MPVQPIVEFPDPALSTPCRHVDNFDSSLGELVRDLIDTMIAEHGIGVAANQIGSDLTVLAIGIPSCEQPLVFINPRIVRQSTPVQMNQEGCLSLPGYWGQPMRSVKIRIEYQDARSTVHRLDAEEYLAQVIQHEIDHLNGLVYEQRLPAGESLIALDTDPDEEDLRTE